MSIVDNEVFHEVEKFMKERVLSYTVEAELNDRERVAKVYSFLVSSMALLGDLVGYSYRGQDMRDMQEHMVYVLRSCAERAAKQRQEERDEGSA